MNKKAWMKERSKCRKRKKRMEMKEQDAFRCRR